MLIFSRQLDGPLTSLVKAVDGLVKAHEAEQMQAFVTFLTDDAASLQPKLEAAAQKEGITMPLTIASDGAAGPAGYRLDPKVQNQVLVYRRKTVQASFSLGSPTDAEIQAVVKAAEKMLASAQ